MVWDHLGIDKAHIAYAVIAVFSAVFSLISLFVKEKLYIGEATVASVYGLIVGPHCLNWFAPTSWGNSDYITLELSRIVLVVQIFAVSVELPKKYMAKHALSVVLLLVPVMTAGWLIVGAFIYVLIPGLNFADSLIVSACITATDPVLAAAVVGKGKFAQRVPGHLRNILSAESGCNDGLAFPFIFLGLNLVMHHGHPGEIVKDWFCVSILYECVFGCLLGVVIGYCGRHAIKFAEGKNLIDRESFLAFYIVLALMSAGFGAMLGVDDLLVSFAAGAAFSWDGWFARKTEETHVSTVIDLLLNTSYFVYFGAIIPWEQFNNHSIGTDVWRLVVLAIVVLFLRRIPAVLALKPFIPDIKTWREALFCGHFGPIGVGAVYAAIVARAELETLDTTESTPLRTLPPEDSEHYQLIACIWPIVTFLIISSIIVHGSSVAVLTLGRHLNSMAISMTFTTTNTANTGTTWLNRLPKLEANGRSFSLQRVDTTAPKKHDGEKQVETSGIKYRPAGGMDRRNRRNRRKNRLSKLRSRQEYLDRNRPEPEQFDLSQLHKRRVNEGANSKLEFEEKSDSSNLDSEAKSTNSKKKAEKTESTTNLLDREASHTNAEPVQAYGEGNRIIVEGHDGEIIDTIDLDLNGKPTRKSAPLEAYRQHQKENIPDDHLVALESDSLLTSSISRVGSRVSNKIKSLPISRLRSNKKAFAYKVDNYLVIENEDGEVIRRYHIHQHSDASNDAARPRSNSIMGKTLKAVGLKKLTSEPDPLGKSSAKATQQIIGDLQDKEETHIVPADETAAVVMSHDLQDADNSFTESEETDESEPGEETEVEKRRRLAALSKRPLPRDEDDEEEAPPTAASK